MNQKRGRGTPLGAKRGEYSARKRWFDFAFVRWHTLTLEEVRRNQLRPYRVRSWQALAEEHPRGLSDTALKKAFDRACDDARIEQAWYALCKRVKLFFARLPNRPHGQEALSLRWLALKGRLGGGRPPASLLPQRKAPPREDELLPLQMRFWDAYRDSANFRAKFRGDARRRAKQARQTYARWGIALKNVEEWIDPWWLERNRARVEAALRRVEGAGRARRGGDGTRTRRPSARRPATAALSRPPAPATGQGRAKQAGKTPRSAGSGQATRPQVRRKG